MSFFERAWASRRTEVSVFDVVTVLELVRAQPFDKVYPSDLYIIGDSAYAVRRSVHAYNVVPIIDYVLISRVPAVHVYDIVPTYDLAYVSRRNIVHAYDVITQLDAADKSGNVTLSATDILSTPEWFFRVSKAIKIFEAYIPFELATASAVHTIFAEDLSVVYDLGASINTIKTVYAFDKLVADSISYTKSYSPLFFSILRRKVPIVYKTLSVLDTVAISERVNYTKSYNTLFFSLFRRRVPVVYKTLSVIDVLAVADSLSITVVKTVPASDYVVFDSVAYTKSYSPLFFSLFQRRVPIVYKTLSVLDTVAISERVDYTKSYSPLFFSLFQRRVPIVYKTLSVLDIVAVRDSASVVPIKVVSVLDVVPVADRVDVKNIAVSVSDYVVYDYVPSMSPSDILFESMYASNAVNGVSVADVYTLYERVDIIKRSIAVNDVVAVFENASAVKL